MPSQVFTLAARALFGASAITESHREVGMKLVTMGELFFAGEHNLGSSLKFRLNPLIVGPTGAGKTSLVQSVARLHNARYFKVTRSDWLVQGATRGRPTLYQILDYVTTHKRVLIHIDELDKFQINFGAHEWSASIGGDLWNLLDGAYPVPEYLRDTPIPENERPTEEQVREWIQARAWVVGSGTWQDVFDRKRTKTAFGFQATQGAPVGVEAISESRLICSELLGRFCSELLVLRYPNRDETARLLEVTGINAIARELGQRISPDDVNFEHGGMRALESIATRLAIARHERRGKRPGPPIPSRDGLGEWTTR